MPEIVDDDILQMHIQESKEHLETIESDLLEIEQGGEDIDDELVNKVFRAAHSIKGGSSFLGLNTIKDLAHKTENVLDMIRKRQMVPTPAVVNVVLQAFDRLGELFGNVFESNEMDILEQVASLHDLINKNLTPDEKVSVDQEVEILSPEVPVSFSVSKFDLNQALHGDNSLYILEYDLIKDVHRQGKTPLDIIKALNDNGMVVDIKVELATAGDLDSDEIVSRLPMFVLYSTIVEVDLVGMLLGLTEDNIHCLPDGMETGATGSSPPPPQVTEEAAMEKTVPEKTVPEKTVKTSAKVAKTKKGKATPTPPARQKKTTKKSTKKTTKPKSLDGSNETIRVHVSVLDQLMNRVGELVLARNELLQTIVAGEKKAMTAAGQRINQVTSELQAAIMLTRMQPVANIFSKFTRVVRDLASDMGKDIDITLEGKEVELDKTIIEGLADPLTHLVRNSCDHGIELPDVRLEKGKGARGSINLRAYHESGQVIIEIEDDGKGLDCEKLKEAAISKGLITEEQAAAMSDKEKTELIMLPGFSMAKQVTDVSGRGVGMDVVNTNLDKLGGEVELISAIDKGTTVRIKLPLTLAIIPSLLISSCGERFALPQINVGELMRISAAEIHEKIEKVGGADVLILRGELMPLLQLNNVLELKSTYYDPGAGQFKEDRRKSIADMRRLEDENEELKAEGNEENSLDLKERRHRRSSDVSIVVLQAGAFRFGLVVEEVHDTVEIVVKPLGRHLKMNAVFAGSTIMGDGNVALILDVAGMARKTELRSLAERTKAINKSQSKEKNGATRQALLLFQNGLDEYCAVPLHLVLRVEQIKTDDIEVSGSKKVIQYRGGSLPIYALEEVANVNMLEERAELVVIIFVVSGREVGLLASPPLDVIEKDLVLDEHTLKQPGISASAIIRGKTTLIVDIFEFMQALNPDWFEDRSAAPPLQSASGEDSVDNKTILLVEDSMFFRAQIKQVLESEGHQVVDVEDGKEAWEYLTANPADIGLVVTDIEMPNMDGFELTGKIKSDKRFSPLKVIALTSLASEEDTAKGKEVGIDDYQIKMDKEKLLQRVSQYLRS